MREECEGESGGENTVTTWRTENIITGCCGYGWYYAHLDGYDPTPWDDDTPATGPRSKVGYGSTEPEALADLLDKLPE